MIKTFSTKTARDDLKYLGMYYLFCFFLVCLTMLLATESIKNGMIKTSMDWEKCGRKRYYFRIYLKGLRRLMKTLVRIAVLWYKISVPNSGI